MLLQKQNLWAWIYEKNAWVLEPERNVWAHGKSTCNPSTLDRKEWISKWRRIKRYQKESRFFVRERAGLLGVLCYFLEALQGEVGYEREVAPSHGECKSWCGEEVHGHIKSGCEENSAPLRLQIFCGHFFTVTCCLFVSDLKTKRWRRADCFLSNQKHQLGKVKTKSS